MLLWAWAPDYNDNPDPRLFAYNLFGELEPLQKPKRQPRQPRTEEDKPKPTPKIEISDATAKKFRPLSEKELEFYGSLNWEDNPPINGFYEAGRDYRYSRAHLRFQSPAVAA